MEGSLIKQGLADLGFVVRNNEIAPHLKDGRPLICVEFKHKPSFKYYTKHLLGKKCCIFHCQDRWVVVCLAPLGAAGLRAAQRLETTNIPERLMGFEATAVPGFSLDGFQHADVIAGTPYVPETVWRAYFKPPLV